MSDRLMLDELVDAVALDLASARPADPLAPAGSSATAFLAEGNSFAYAAYLDNAVAGGFWGVRIRHPAGSISVEVVELYVLATARGRGIGSLLIESASAHARREGAAELFMRAGPDLAAMAIHLAATPDPDGSMVRWTFG